MTQISHKFSSNRDSDFILTLRTRVREYFEMNKKERHGSAGMWLKTLFMISLFVAPFVLMLTGVFANPFLIILMWALMGIGVAGIGLSVMHDANHGSYSKSKFLNNLAGGTLYLLGGSARIWKMQHNTLHHSYTNIEGSDDDISAPFFLRFSPHQKQRWIHRFQHIYAWFFYGFLTMTWITYNDFIKVFKFRERGLITGKGKMTVEIGRIIGWKIFYYGYMLVLPMLLMPVSPWLILISFLCMHWITGFILSVIFQSAHVMPTVEFPLPDENGRIENNWAVHQMLTTTNFSPRSRIFSWFIGGLNYQVEHHLFSNICHVHYRALSRIVSSTAAEFGIPYHTEKNFVSTVFRHGRMLRLLGKPAKLVA